MPSVCLYFQVHQPYRLKKYSFFDIGHDHIYEDEKLNKEILHKVSEKCYLPANNKILELIKRHEGKFRISYSVSGTALEQFEKYRPDVLQSFIELSKTGCVEFLSETYNHSLSYLFSKTEFEKSVLKHRAKIKEHFNQIPSVFRNTELIYNNNLSLDIEKMGFKGILCEGVDHLLGNRNANFIYQAPGATKLKNLLKNYRLSDDIAFRFSDKNWSEYPLNTKKYATYIHQIAGNGEIINLFMDYETFGEHQWAETGIFNFLDQLPSAILKHPDFNFKTPSEIIEYYPIRGIYDVPHFISWADTERDLSAWLSNSMQEEAMQKIFSLEKSIQKLKLKKFRQIWENLQTSDHFYYMCTKFWNDGDVHKYFSPYDSPYEAYIFFMNVFTDFEIAVKKRLKKQEKNITKISKPLSQAKVEFTQQQKAAYPN